MKWNPLQKVYLYRDEESAAEDMAFILFQVWKFPVDWRWYVRGGVVSHQSTNLSRTNHWTDHFTRRLSCLRNVFHRSEAKTNPRNRRGRNRARRARHGHSTRRPVRRTVHRQAAAPPQPHHLPLVLGASPRSPLHPPGDRHRSRRGRGGRGQRGRQRPNLAVTNKADRPLLIPEGEILIGAKQNRVVNVTVLVAAGVKFVMPVSCVEAGRWRYQSRHFESKFCAPPSLRNKKLKAVQRNRAAGGRAESDQGEVWDEVRSVPGRVDARSETASLTDGFLASEKRWRSTGNEFSLPEEAAGVLVAKGTHDHRHGPVRFARDAPGDVGSAVGRLLLRCPGRQPQAPGNQPQVGAGVSRPRCGTRPSPGIPALGLGEELEIAGEGSSAALCSMPAKLCHLAAFSDECLKFDARDSIRMPSRKRIPRWTRLPWKSTNALPLSGQGLHVRGARLCSNPVAAYLNRVGTSHERRIPPGPAMDSPADLGCPAVRGHRQGTGPGGGRQRQDDPPRPGDLPGGGLPAAGDRRRFGRKKWHLESAKPPAELNFTWDEAAALYLGRRFLEPLMGTVFWQAAREAFRKIQAVLEPVPREYLDKFATMFCQTMVGTHDYSKKADLIDALMQAIEDSQAVSMTYQSLQATEPVTYTSIPTGWPTIAARSTWSAAPGATRTSATGRWTGSRRSS